MPIYAYQCTNCGKEEEYIQKFSDPPMETCEHCSGPLRRLVTTAAFHLKGGGWYKDLYASSKPGESKPSGGSSESKSESSTTTTTTESKSKGSSESKAAS
ncbi:MAG: FmdB family zinc ribbon protein [Nannocystaceae bacterium]